MRDETKRQGGTIGQIDYSAVGAHHTYGKTMAELAVHEQEIVRRAYAAQGGGLFEGLRPLYEEGHGAFHDHRATQEELEADYRRATRANGPPRLTTTLRSSHLFS